MFKPCAVIPYYNHPRTIAAVVRTVLSHDLPCVVVDDGSADEAREVLEPLSDHELVTVLCHPVNRGKGGAVQTGLRWAAEQGYTHALQVDADGQHNLDDIPRFLARAEASPGALILGRPVFDQSVPVGRYLARYITHVWVWIETLSLEIKDTMCGFRVYPLAEVVPLLERKRLGERMDFDIEVVVRLYWQWIPIVHLDTAVTYDTEGPSHFQPFRDNVRISWLHTRLFLGMLLRLPVLLFRIGKKRRQQSQDWLSMKERGAVWGIRATLWIYKVLGRRVSTALVYVVIFYFFLVARAGRWASQRYLRRLYDFADQDPALFGGPPGFFDSYRHFLQFGLAALDKFAAWMGDLSLHDIDDEAIQPLRDVVRQGQGVVLLGSHFGNLEVLRALRHDSDFVVNALMLVSNAERFHRVLKEVHPGMDMKIIPAESIGVETALAMKEKVERGEIVALLADRLTPDSRHRYSEVSFLGHPAPLPHGPMILASLLECPVFLIFVVRGDDGRYTIRCEPFAERLELPRKHREERLQQLLARYAQRLEAQCLREPFQWFNFYDFWASPPSSPSTRHSLASRKPNHEAGTR